MELGRALQTHRTARLASHTKLAHEYKESISATVVLSEALDEVQRVFFSAVQ